MDEAALFRTFPTLATPRLILREIVPGDAESYHHVYGEDHDNATWQTRLDPTIDDTRARIARIADAFAAREGIRWGIAASAGTARDAGRAARAPRFAPW
jgi:RimJ/RimL family protein N-acetyltransferase